MSKVYVYSTLATSVAYTIWERGANDLPRAKKRIVVKGGTGVANAHVLTPWGVCTIITPEEFALLQEDRVFKQHYDAGFLRVSGTRLDPEVAAADMSLSDASLPIVPEDYAGNDDGPKPVGVDTDRPGSGGSHKNRSRKKAVTGPRAR
jgi:hypothetical protein